jgi:26S proteasome regulatory subunit N2
LHIVLCSCELRQHDSPVAIVAGGRNVTVGMVSATGTYRRTSIVAMALFLQHWFWFPMAYMLPLSFKCTALIGVTKELKLPKFGIECAREQGTFAYADAVSDNAKKKARACAL